jgi:5-deoxy-glucuronate isomerase
MSAHIATHRGGFAPGFTAITRREAQDNPSAIGMGVLRLSAGERYSATVDCETAWLLMDGEVSGNAASSTFSLSRGSLFDESASCVHVPAKSVVVFEARTNVELTVYDCANRSAFAPRVFTPEQVPNEARGRGQVGERALRYVRTIFDRRNSPPEVELVLGEVVTFPGGWSSYPPHHHPQPEIYHYRFTQPQGYGHAELGESVFKVRQFDTMKISAGLDHAQCAAPGYGMYYSWVIRHLPDAPYTAPEFTSEHAWALDAEAEFWRPEDFDGAGGPKSR